MLSLKGVLVVGGLGSGLLALFLVPVIGLLMMGQTAVVAAQAADSTETARGYDNLPVMPGEWVHPLGGSTPWTSYNSSGSHAGGAVDFPVPAGTPVYAPSNGLVMNLSEPCGGQMLGIRHADGTKTVFAHLSQFIATPGEAIESGELLALSGSTGRCVNGAHLHMEVHLGEGWGTFIPTYRYMKQRGVELGPCQSPSTACQLAY